MRKQILFWLTVFTLFACHIGKGQTVSDTSQLKKYQAKAPKTQPFGKEAFEKSKNTTLRWLGMAGFLINSRRTTFMVDPLLEGFDMPMLINFPIDAKDVPHLDAVFVTHADNDHFSKPTNLAVNSCDVDPPFLHVAPPSLRGWLPRISVFQPYSGFSNNEDIGVNTSDIPAC